MSQRHSAHEILEDPDFKALSRQKDSISIVLTLITLVVYFGFISVIAFKKEWLAPQVGGVTIGIYAGIGVILASIVLTGIYVRWANSTYDTLVEKVKRKVEASDALNQTSSSDEHNTAGRS